MMSKMMQAVVIVGVAILFVVVVSKTSTGKAVSMAGGSSPMILAAAR
jgi:hypothetical protein